MANPTLIVNDLFFDYERGEKLGLWVLAIDSGLLLGPTCTLPSPARASSKIPYHT
jgi:hypothetical protein